MTTRRILLPLFILALAGAGCFQIGPRIVKTPVEKSPQSAVTSQQATTSTEPTALAYVRLDGGAATIARGSTDLPAQDWTELDQGDTVMVTQGSIHLVYPDAGVSELANGTKLTIIPDDGEGETGVFAQIRLQAGSIWTRFEKVFGPSERFSVESNGVVATVRGTAFGVTAENGGVDVQVADHEVLVSTETEDDQTGSSVPQGNHIVAVVAGQGLRITAATLLKIDATSVRTAVRMLNATERATAGFLFGTTTLTPEQLRRPANPIRLQTAPVVSPDLETRIQTLRRSAMLERVFPHFAAPLRAPLENELNTTSTPSVSGPTSAPLQ